jgi:hypothetical protein
MDPTDDGSRAFLRRMAVVEMAGLRNQRDGSAAPDGAALTYARRYALSTLVGIAGEDDLDAPDLGAGTKIVAEPPSGNGNGVGPVDAPTVPISKSQMRRRLTPASQNSSAPRRPFWRPNRRPRCSIA